MHYYTSNEVDTLITGLLGQKLPQLCKSNLIDCITPKAKIKRLAFDDITAPDVISRTDTMLTQSTSLNRFIFLGIYLSSGCVKIAIRNFHSLLIFGRIHFL